MTNITCYVVKTPNNEEQSNDRTFVVKHYIHIVNLCQELYFCRYVKKAIDFLSLCFYSRFVVYTQEEL
jgi:hypothetical protein